ncbi:MAG: glycosyltransferase family 39 protein [Chloroflexi bacterium]|nr:glycosyltransferase family 39 protein [Chloroflexota bacterium]
MDEPTVLDYVKEKLTFWRSGKLSFPDTESAAVSPALEASEAALPEFLSLPAAAAAREINFPWHSSLALVAALIAQLSLEPSWRSLSVGITFYLIAAGLVVWGALEGEWAIPPLREDERLSAWPAVRPESWLIGALLAGLTYLVFAGGKFNLFNLIIWGLTLGYFLRILWVPAVSGGSWIRRLWGKISRSQWEIHFSRWTLLVAMVIALVVFFRTYQLVQVPPEMVSDHAEKLLDVSDVLNGQTSVFFPRNTGREAIQFYLTAGIILLFHTGLTFLSLKIGTVLGGLLTLPYIYLLGKEIGNKRVGLIAVLFAGIAYWPNIFSRIGLRFTLYPLFVAPTLYYLIRGLRTARRNDFILAGIALGLGLQGYTSFRITPFVVVAGVALYLLHRQSRGARLQAIYGLGIIALVSFVVFLPLFRYAIDNPQLFAFRAFSRLGSVERPLPGPAGLIFLQNLWNAVTMFFWSDGEIWVHSVTFRPALDVVSAALFFLGIALVVIRYLRQRNWTDPFLLLSIPLLMMPSILSLAFPAENPSLNRTAGAIVPVFLLVGIGLDALLSGIKERLPRDAGMGLVSGVILVLVAWSASQNYDLVFNQYERVYQQSSWNTTEIGQVIRGFAGSVGTADSAWVVGFPYWVDTRLVGINAGYPTKDYAIWPDQISATRQIAGAKLFILNPQDTQGLDTLRSVYPQGSLSTYQSRTPTKDFLMYLVSPTSSQ